MPTNAVATVLQDYVAMYSPSMDRNEQRPSNYAALDMFKKQTASPGSILDANIRTQLEKSFNTSVKVPVVNYKDVTIGNARTCALQADGITTSLVTLTAITYTFGFLGYPMQHYENYVSYQQATAKLIDAGLQKLASTIDAACVAFLETNKNQHFPAEMLDYYTETGDAFQVPQAGKSDFYNRIGSIMQTADFGTDGIDIVTNPLAMAYVRFLGAQGQANSTNLAFQLLGYTWWPTNRVVNASGVEQTLYLVAPNSVAIVFRNSPDAKAKTRIHESKYWDLFPNAPYIGADLDVFYQAECADASAVQASGMTKLTQTKVESWQFAVDVFYLKFYNSAPSTRYSPIIKVEILEAP
jgi:hypothetical protein